MWTFLCLTAVFLKQLLTKSSIYLLYYFTWMLAGEDENCFSSTCVSPVPEHFLFLHPLVPQGQEISRKC